MSDDYKDTIFLPQTEFPMRGELPKREPQILAEWKKLDLFKTLTTTAAEREKFILHFGPPFANGNIHAGHALTKILKDVVVRTRFALGYNAPMVPGWDCHGLPIEWKIEEKYRAEKKNKDEVSPVEFRRECREFAAHWAKVQSEDMQRLGVVADWANPYLTMNYKSEAAIAAEIHKFLMNGMLYRGVRPILWSVVEKTALAAAEVEYHEHTSTTVFVAFPVINSTHLELADTSVVIWTTTPWTLPGNRAIALGKDMDYAQYEITEVDAESKVVVGSKFLLSTQLAEGVLQAAKVTGFNKLKEYKGSELSGMRCAHPLAKLDKYYTFEVPVLEGDFVTTETGTGFVHIAPGHGEDDYYLGKANGIEIPETVDGDGTYFPQVGLFAGVDVYDANGKEGKATGAVIGKLVEAGALVAKGKLRHSYPHSWRSKAPLIFRTTAQWFIEIDKSGLRDKALGAIKETKWIPAEGENRITAMVKDRPDWCISRQRLWGVPIAIFVNKNTREPLRDEDVNNRIIKAFEMHSADAWYAMDKSEFLGPEYNPDDFEQVMDIVDVWFESGSTHAFVLEQHPDQQWPADLYLEGSDQHRGWFQSSLLESCGTRGRAPFKSVLTHGFVNDKDGKKMSKSIGNVTAPDELWNQYGADIIRLWVVGSNYTEDLKLSHESFKLQSDIYRRLRNTLRYVLGNLDGFNASERIDLEKEYSKLPTLEQWVLHRMQEVNGKVKEAVAEYKFNDAMKAVFDFCNEDLSAFYFDIRKDRLYCDRPDMFERRATRSVLEAILDALTTWLAPFIPFTAEEAWQSKGADILSHYDVKTVHQKTYPEFPSVWKNLQVESDWETLRTIRSVVTGAIEIERAEKRIGSSLEAHPTLYLADAQDQKLAATIDWSELAITSQFTLAENAPENAFRLPDVKDVAVVVNKAVGEKCQRSWKILPDVGSDPEFPGLSKRDADAVRYYRAQEKAA